MVDDHRVRRKAGPCRWRQSRVARSPRSDRYCADRPGFAAPWPERKQVICRAPACGRRRHGEKRSAVVAGRAGRDRCKSAVLVTGEPFALGLGAKDRPGRNGAPGNRRPGGRRRLRFRDGSNSRASRPSGFRRRRSRGACCFQVTAHCLCIPLVHDVPFGFSPECRQLAPLSSEQSQCRSYNRLMRSTRCSTIAPFSAMRPIARSVSPRQCTATTQYDHATDMSQAYRSKSSAAGPRSAHAVARGTPLLVPNAPMPGGKRGR